MNGLRSKRQITLATQLINPNVLVSLPNGRSTTVSLEINPFIHLVSRSVKRVTQVSLRTRSNKRSSYLTDWACVLSETDGESSSSLKVGVMSTRQTLDACCNVKVAQKSTVLFMLT